MPRRLNRRCGSTWNSRAGFLREELVQQNDAEKLVQQNDAEELVQQNDAEELAESAKEVTKQQLQDDESNLHLSMMQ
ncbi:unnamed protein product [Nesidiocoris tenuis]|uniref:Uncharacterized protein n=1 Tax=Nesidiocoris tenuis TaxID=355587 RepID=A0A6H5GQ10_9HEMI|nr:unnamed protein product [Nesidiocoris tenuis]